jgi:hypothetical protein
MIGCAPDATFDLIPFVPDDGSIDGDASDGGCEGGDVCP